MPDSRETQLSVIIPIFNEEANLGLLYERVLSAVAPLSLNFELIFINDGSRDRSLVLIQALAATDSRVKFISFSRNFGHQIAVSAGLDAAKGEAIVIIDADLQDPPELIVDLYRKMQEGYEVVYARRRRRQGESFMKLLTAKAFYRILRSITSVEIPVDTGDFRIMHRKVAEVLRRMPEQQKFLRGQISWIGFRQTFVEYDRQSRAGGQTGYTYSKMLRFAMDGITSFSDFPLKMATLIGFAVSGIAFLVLLYALYSRLISHDYVPGWASLITCVLFLGGIQLLTIGIIGEYVGRLSANVKNRPLYVIDLTNVDKDGAQ
ncbi:MAG: glycosyltransferase family 2 protein [Bacteroidota bacterium]